MPTLGPQFRGSAIWVAPPSGELSRSEKRLDRWGNRLTTVRAGLVGFEAIAAAGLGMAAQSAAKLEQSVGAPKRSAKPPGWSTAGRGMTSEDAGDTESWSFRAHRI